MGREFVDIWSVVQKGIGVVAEEVLTPHSMGHSQKRAFQSIGPRVWVTNTLIFLFHQPISSTKAGMVSVRFTEVSLMPSPMPETE